MNMIKAVLKKSGKGRVYINDPIYLVYKYKEGELLSPILTTNFGQNCGSPDKRN